MPSNYFLKLFLVVLLSLITFFVCLEIALHIFGFIYSHYRYEDSDIHNSDSTTILCFGDSYTEGTGIQPQFSYPSQLQSLCDIAFGEKAVTIINRGRGTQNTSMLLDTYSDDLARYNPEIILLLTGGANTWNYKEYDKYHETGFLRRTYYEILDNLKTVRLIRLIIRNIKTKLVNIKIARLRQNKELVSFGHAKDSTRAVMRLREEAHDAALRHDYKRGVELYRKAVMLTPYNTLLYNECVNLSREYTQYEEVADVIKYGLQFMPSSGLLYFHLAVLYDLHNMPHQGFVFAEEGIRKEPGFQHNYLFCLNYVRQYGGYDAFIERLKKEVSDSVLAKHYISLIEKKKDTFQSVIDEWIYNDLCAFITIAREHNCSVVLQTYPHPRIAAWENSIIRMVSKKMNVSLVDHGSFFNNLLIQGEEEETLFVPDGHCTKRGYRLMAEEIFEKIQNMLNKTKL